ncbi:TlyA family RNA methyltransferase [Candidatus Magnetominusculus xianensis]|uniref:RNA methyltransferase n=1 Tax=Candidatus Magnetominusculus xianensis TaxID=1748249 RepID=A0ABR5SKK0_9BACT|nr:TlyA family RNA methyltransferase [Candidatus Magnetominusculus xianensis]KWT92802.1 RNA methyltransferase [Candidatus Magnetominusculus xianensis]MBF0403390.1 TlyA family RNA methyltransferase [Nitrospirota bacterium]
MKKRLDILLTQRGLAPSRERAKALIMENKVLVSGQPVDKAGCTVDESAEITVRETEAPFVSRAGLKLSHALDEFKIDVTGKTIMDVGASTGGFTDCLLKRGAGRVFAIDVGYGQLAWALRNDARVIPIERTNIRYLEREKIPCAVDMVVIDVSFISLRLVVPVVLRFLQPTAAVVALIKPQFEVGRGQVGKGGIVAEEDKRLRVVDEMKEFFSSSGLFVHSVCESPIRGQKGNVEYFIHAS